MLRLNSKRNETLMAFKSPVVFMEGMKRPVLRNSTNEEIGARLRLTRLAFMGEDNASAFARLFGWSAQRLRNYELGHNAIRNEVFAAIEEKTGVTIQWLARGDETGSEYTIMKRIKEIEAQEADPNGSRIPRTRGRTAVGQGLP